MEMITNILDIEPNHTVDSAPKYDSSVTILKAVKALIVRKGTVNKKSTVDIQCVDETGKKYLIMATGAILVCLGRAIEGGEDINTK